MKSLNALRLPKQENLIKKTGEELVEELNKSIDDYLATRNTPEQKKVGGFHPSYTNQCARYWYYLFEGTEVTPSFKSQTYRIFDNGHAVHERLYSYLRGMGILVAEEIPVTYDSPPIEGTADGIIDINGHKLI